MGAHTHAIYVSLLTVDRHKRPGTVPRYVYTRAMRLLWDDKPLDGAVGAVDIVTATRRFHRHVQRRLDLALEDSGLSYSQYELLEMLYRHPRVHGAQLARQLRVSRQTVTGLLRRLSHAGLIKLTPREYWTRGANLTDLGTARLRLCRDAIVDVHERIDRAGSEKLERLLDLLEEIDWTMQQAEWWPEIDGAWQRNLSRR